MKRRMKRRNPWPKGKSRKKFNAGKKAARTRKANRRKRSLAAKKAWRTRRRRGH